MSAGVGGQHWIPLLRDCQARSPSRQIAVDVKVSECVKKDGKPFYDIEEAPLSAGGDPEACKER